MSEKRNVVAGRDLNCVSRLVVHCSSSANGKPGPPTLNSWIFDYLANLYFELFSDHNIRQKKKFLEIVWSSQFHGHIVYLETSVN